MTENDKIEEALEQLSIEEIEEQKKDTRKVISLVEIRNDRDFLFMTNKQIYRVLSLLDMAYEDVLKIFDILNKYWRLSQYAKKGKRLDRTSSDPAFQEARDVIKSKSHEAYVTAETIVKQVPLAVRKLLKVGI